MKTVFRIAAWLTAAASFAALDGCAVAAFPCRVTSAVVKVIPVVGHGAATPFDACAAAID